MFEADERHAGIHVGPRPNDGDAVGVHAAAASVLLGPPVRASQPLLLSLVDALAGNAADAAWDASMSRLGISRRVRFDFARRVSHLLTVRWANCPRCRRSLGLELALPPLAQPVDPTAQDMRPGVVDQGGRVRQLKNLADRCAAADAATSALNAYVEAGGVPACVPPGLSDAVRAMALRPELSSGCHTPDAEERATPGGSGRCDRWGGASAKLLHASLSLATAGCDGSLGSYLERIVEASGRRSKGRAPSDRRSWRDAPWDHGPDNTLLEEPCSRVRHAHATPARRQLLPNAPFTTAREVAVTLAAAINACTLCRNYLRWTIRPPPECRQLLWPPLRGGVLVCTGAGRRQLWPGGELLVEDSRAERPPQAPALKAVASAFFGPCQQAHDKVRPRAPPIGLAGSPVLTAVASPLGCGNPLAMPDAILSQMHAWDAGRGYEEAWYLNHLLEGAAVAEPARRERLAQGEMSVADLCCCRCGAAVGWVFDADAEPDGRNTSQVGRVGLVVSSLWHQSPPDPPAGHTRT